MIENTPIHLRAKPTYIHGLGGLAKLIGCSKPTAQKIKDSGKIPFVKIGRKFIFDEEKVMAALEANNKEVSNG